MRAGWWHGCVEEDSNNTLPGFTLTWKAVRMYCVRMKGLS
jgi:hypothetical protein